MGNRTIGSIGNYYSGLEIKERNGRFFWSIEDWEECEWEEIPKYLYDALNKFQDEIEQNFKR